MSQDERRQNRSEGVVLDFMERRAQTQEKNSAGTMAASLRALKEAEKFRLGVPAGILSIIALGTVANHELLSQRDSTLVSSNQIHVESFASRLPASVPSNAMPVRGIASIPTGVPNNEDALVKDLSDATDIVAEGKSPTAMERLAIGTLAGVYDLKLDRGYLASIEWSGRSTPKTVGDIGQFLHEQKSNLGVAFDRAVRLRKSDVADGSSEYWQLVDRFSVPVADLDFKLNSSGQLLAMNIARR